MQKLYKMIYKRKSMRKFDSELKLTKEELDAIMARVASLSPLCPDIKLSYRLLPRTETNAKWGEYCLLIYSEKQPNYLQNVGYMIEELDLYLASIDVGACWYGMGRVSKDEGEHEGLPYAMMIAFGKSRPEDFRADKIGFDRKELFDIWEGELALDAAEAARYSPSACNSQPWRAVCGDGNTVTLYKKCGKLDIMGRVLCSYFNPMDMGIYMRIFELALDHYGYSWERELYDSDPKEEMSLTAKYTIK